MLVCHFHNFFYKVMKSHTCISWETWWISRKSSGKMEVMMVLKWLKNIALHSLQTVYFLKYILRISIGFSRLSWIFLLDETSILFFSELANFGHYCTSIPPLGLGLGLWLVLSHVSSWRIISSKRGVQKWNSANLSFYSNN